MYCSLGSSLALFSRPYSFVAYLWPVMLTVQTAPTASGMCTDFTFKCQNGECVNKVNVECDHNKDCADGSDEEGCGKSIIYSLFCLFLETFNTTKITGVLSKFNTK